MCWHSVAEYEKVCQRARGYGKVAWRTDNKPPDLMAVKGTRQALEATPFNFLIPLWSLRAGSLSSFQALTILWPLYTEKSPGKAATGEETRAQQGTTHLPGGNSKLQWARGGGKGEGVKFFHLHSQLSGG